MEFHLTSTITQCDMHDEKFNPNPMPIPDNEFSGSAMNDDSPRGAQGEAIIGIHIEHETEKLRQDKVCCCGFRHKVNDGH